MKMLIEVERVAIPVGSSVGLGAGRPVGDPTKMVIFVGGARAMYALGMAINETNAVLGDPPVADVPDFAVVDVLELPEE
jgi:hypothetical protein